MKKLFLIIIGLCLCTALYADMNPYIIGGVEAGGGCQTGCAGTEDFCWSGEYDSDTDKACVNAGTLDGAFESGASAKAAYPHSGTYSFAPDGSSDLLKWSVTTSEFSDTEGYASIWVYITDADGIPSGYAAYLFEAHYSGSASNNTLYALINDAEQVYVGHKGNNVKCSFSTTATVSTQQAVQIEIRWHQNDGTDEIQCRIDGGSWESEADGDVLTAWDADGDRLLLGEDVTGAAITYTNCYIDDLQVWTTYDQQ